MKQTLAFVLGVLILALPAGAQQRKAPPQAAPGMGKGMGPGMGPGMGMMHGMDQGMGYGMLGMGLMPILMQNDDELKLTDEQLGKLHRIHTKHMNAGKDLMKVARQTKTSVKATLADPAADETAVRAVAKAHAEAFNKMVDEALAERNEIMAVLTADQKAKLKTMKAPEMPCDNCPWMPD